MMKASGGFGSRWMTDLINNIVKECCIPDAWRKSTLVHVYKGKGDPSVWAPNDTAYKRWSCHSGYKLLCKLCRNLPPPEMGGPFFRQAGHIHCKIPCGPAGWLALLLIKAGDVYTNPGQTKAQYTDTWACHLHRESRPTFHTDITPPHHTYPGPIPVPTPHLHHPHHRNPYPDTRPKLPLFSQDW